MKKIIAMILMVATLVTCCAFGFTACNNDEKEDVVKVIDVPLTSEDYAYCIKKGNTELKDTVDTFLDNLKASGELDNIIKKYFDGNATFEYENPSSKVGCFVVATNAYFPPFEYYTEDGKYSGIDMEIAYLLAQQIGKPLYIADDEFDLVLPNVKSGAADIGMAGITVDSTRLATHDFSKSYYTSSQVVIVKNEDTTFDNCKTAADVEKVLSEQKKSYIVGTQKGTTGYMYTAGDEGFGYDGFKNLSVNDYANGSIAVKALLNGKVNAVIIDKQPAIMICKNYNA